MSLYTRPCVLYARRGYVGEMVGKRRSKTSRYPSSLMHVVYIGNVV